MNTLRYGPPLSSLKGLIAFRPSSRCFANTSRPSRIVFDENGLPLSLGITPQAVKRLKELEKTRPNRRLRLVVESGGCHGFQYQFSLDSQTEADDVVFERDGVEVVVDETSLPFVRGAEVDFMDELIGSAFRVINNPAAGSGCGCGTSFEYKPPKPQADTIDATKSNKFS